MASAVERTESPLVVIVGPTASGKTNLAVDLAELYDGEIVCADSRTVYKNMDIGTAKPSEEDRRRVHHWGLDLVEPNKKFSAADFKTYADNAIADIRRRGKVPFLVGGTGLYIDAVIFNFQFGVQADEGMRRSLEGLSVAELIHYCDKNNIILPENRKNKRYLIRTIERSGENLKRQYSPIDNTIIVGIATNKQTLHTRIDTRSEQFFSHNVVGEAMKLGKKYGWDSEAMTGNIYPVVRSVIDGTVTIEDAIKKFQLSDRSLAKRQMTWFRRNPYIVWCKDQDARGYLKDILATL